MKSDLSDSKCGMAVGARQAGLSSSETADLQGRFTEDGMKKIKYPVSSSSQSKTAKLTGKQQ